MVPLQEDEPNGFPCCPKRNLTKNLENQKQRRKLGGKTLENWEYPRKPQKTIPQKSPNMVKLFDYCQDANALLHCRGLADLKLGFAWSEAEAPPAGGSCGSAQKESVGAESGGMFRLPNAACEYENEDCHDCPAKISGDGVLWKSERRSRWKPQSRA